MLNHNGCYTNYVQKVKKWLNTKQPLQEIADLQIQTNMCKICNEIINNFFLSITKKTLEERYLFRCQSFLKYLRAAVHSSSGNLMVNTIRSVSFSTNTITKNIPLMLLSSFVYWRCNKNISKADVLDTNYIGQHSWKLSKGLQVSNTL